MKKLTVVNINSLSYTGTTWINLILGCHERAMAIGPLDRFWGVVTNSLSGHWWVAGEPVNTHCLVHGSKCDFWPGFLENYYINQNIFLSLAAYTGKSVLVTNNLSDPGLKSMLRDEAIEVKNIYVARDGRRLVESYLRKNKEKNYLQGITEFLQTSFSNFYFDEKDRSSLSLRYEDIMRDPGESLRLFSSFVGIEYSNDALCYWKRRQHLVGGNPGTIATLRLSEGLSIAEFAGADFYRQQFERMQRLGAHGFFDQRSTAGTVSPMDLFLFDCLAGSDNERLGYERDSFSEEERSEFEGALRRIVAETDLPEYFSAQLRPYFDGIGGAPGGKPPSSRQSAWQAIGRRLRRGLIRRG